jgi:hypothetical protein
MSNMPYYRKHKQRLDLLFEHYKLVSESDIPEFLKAEYPRHLCVLVAGWLEKAIQGLLGLFASSKSRPEIAQYIASTLDHATNLNTEKVLQLIGRFSRDWRNAIEATMSDEQKAAVDTVLGNRNAIAHGQPDNITYARIKQYYMDIQLFVQIVENTIK